MDAREFLEAFTAAIDTATELPPIQSEVNESEMVEFYVAGRATLAIQGLATLECTLESQHKVLVAQAVASSEGVTDADQVGFSTLYMRQYAARALWQAFAQEEFQVHDDSLLVEFKIGPDWQVLVPLDDEGQDLLRAGDFPLISTKQ